jgi:hypothetical protein
MRAAILLAALAAASAACAQDATTYPLICVNAERVERILCPVSAANEEVKACECPEGMNPVTPSDDDAAPRKATGS